MENTIITIARGYGSGGRTIGKALAKELGFAYYDRNLLHAVSETSGINVSLFGRTDEVKKQGLFRRRTDTGYQKEPLPPESEHFISDDNLFSLQAKMIRDLADRQSCVFIGRCADYVLRDRENVIRVFIFADREHCIQNVIDLYGVTRQEAEKTIEETDRQRSSYYKYYTGHDWDNARNYELCLDTGHLGFEKCGEIIKEYIKIRNR